MAQGSRTDSAWTRCAMGVTIWVSLGSIGIKIDQSEAFMLGR
jgi:hypothetical protein